MGIITLVAAGWLFGETVAQSSSISFAYPPAQPSLTINVVDTVSVQWTSNYENTFLYFFCPNGTESDIECESCADHPECICLIVQLQGSALWSQTREARHSVQTIASRTIRIGSGRAHVTFNFSGHPFMVRGSMAHV
jgi:hypothetical protein